MSVFMTAETQSVDRSVNKAFTENSQQNTDHHPPSTMDCLACQLRLADIQIPGSYLCSLIHKDKLIAAPRFGMRRVRRKGVPLAASFKGDIAIVDNDPILVFPMNILELVVQRHNEKIMLGEDEASRNDFYLIICVVHDVASGHASGASAGRYYVEHYFAEIGNSDCYNWSNCTVNLRHDCSSHQRYSTIYKHQD